MPLAKLSKAVKIADTSNQGKAKCETFSAIMIAFREETKSFNKADSVFNITGSKQRQQTNADIPEEKRKQVLHQLRQGEGADCRFSICEVSP